MSRKTEERLEGVMAAFTALIGLVMALVMPALLWGSVLWGDGDALTAAVLSVLALVIGALYLALARETRPF